jgi:hypothetical protein
MTSDQRNTLGNIAGAFGVLGIANPGFSALGWGLRGALANDKYGITSRAGEIGITEQDVRDAMDYGGAYAAADKESQRQAQEAAKASALGAFSTPTDSIAGGPTGGEIGAGWGSNTPSSGFGAGEEAGGQTGGGSAGGGAAGGGPGGGSPGGGPDGEGQGGEGRGGDTDWKGGVRVGTPEKPGKTVFGKVGKETAIFIPEIMKKMGMQGREQEVIRALKTMLQMLEGNQRASTPESPNTERKEHANGRRGQ